MEPALSWNSGVSRRSERSFRPTEFYPVKGNDQDENGISIKKNQLQLRDGTMVDAGGNAATTGKGVPIYNLAGSTITSEKVADDYADFYDGGWDNPHYGRDEDGNHKSTGLVWTGSESDGIRGADSENYAGQPGGMVTYASVRGGGAHYPKGRLTSISGTTCTRCRRC